MASPTERADIIIDLLYLDGIRDEMTDAQIDASIHMPRGSQVVTPEDMAAGWRVLTPEQAAEVDTDREALRIAARAFAQYAYSDNEPSDQVVDDTVDGFRQDADLRRVLAGVPDKDSE